MMKETDMKLNIAIRYCSEWNYLPQASSLAAAIKDKFGLETNLIADHNGIFEVSVNDRIIYNNKEYGGKFPDHGEIINAISGLSE